MDDDILSLDNFAEWVAEVLNLEAAPSPVDRLDDLADGDQVSRYILALKLDDLVDPDVESSVEVFEISDVRGLYLHYLYLCMAPRTTR